MSPADPPRELTAAELRRACWGRNIAAQLAVLNLNVKQFHRELLQHGIDVTTQAIYAWLNGDTAPRPETQIAIAKVLRVSHSMLFPIGTAA